MPYGHGHEQRRREGIAPEELPRFIMKLQEAFSLAVREKFGGDAVVPTDDDIRETFGKAGTDKYFLFEKIVK